MASNLPRGVRRDASSVDIDYDAEGIVKLENGVVSNTCEIENNADYILPVLSYTNLLEKGVPHHECLIQEIPAKPRVGDIEKDSVGTGNARSGIWRLNIHVDDNAGVIAGGPVADVVYHGRSGCLFLLLGD